MEIKFISDEKSLKFQQDLKKLELDFFGEKDNKLLNTKRVGDRRLYFKAIIILSTWIYLYFALLFLPLNSGSQIFLGIIYCILLGITSAAIGFNIMHDGGHGSFSSNDKVNEAAGFSLNILGGNIFLWKVKHNVAHHTSPNVNEHDDDIASGGLMRVHPEQELKPYHRYQHIYVFAIYLAQYFLWIYVLDFIKFAKKEVGGARINVKSRAKFFVEILAYKVMHFAIFCIVPLANHSWKEVALGYAIYLATTGLLISIVFQLAHVVSQAKMVTAKRVKLNKMIHGKSVEKEFDSVDTNNKAHQVQTTANFATDSDFWEWFSGGLNHQIEHHLFPETSHVHYRALSKKVKKLCEEYNLPYNVNPTFFSAVRSHIATLKFFGRRLPNKSPAI